jgi:diacylglycerol kinase (ATP)
MRRRHTLMFLIIHNPLSNNKKSKKTTHKIVRFFQKNHIDFMLRSTLKIENLNSLLDSNPKITDILYCGGDGSINYLINNVDIQAVTQNIYLAQSGSGNDFLRSLKPLQTGNIVIGEAKTNVKTVKFINGCGMGIDASVCYYVNNDSKKSKISYFVNTYRALSSYRKVKMDVTVDGVLHHFDSTYFVSIQNGKYFGGGMKGAPDGDPQSETYQVMVAHTLKKWQVFFLFLTIYPGLHVKIKRYISIFTGKEITIKVDETRHFQADGEVVENVNGFSVKALEKRTFHYFNKKLIKSLYSQK